ncbi:hypothetical protein [Brevundimonas sp. NIBR11]|uniref:hypothetical protein n=1 Tax=Brevundimonas sp. NIBR11 TaxID=3015999 RepID=UPI0022F0D395|nr:hypothetical protein [Brevundimonas sp. NIBR11]WGM32810.1 hypothetical protein KKHFBJBL_03064 [Brevundimonas sp. NIBR11]
MRKFVFAAITAAVLSAATASPAQEALRGVIPPAQQWVDRPSLAPAVTDPATRARMNQEIVQAITAADGDQDEARQAIAAIVARYQAAAEAQAARMRPGPK